MRRSGTLLNVLALYAGAAFVCATYAEEVVVRPRQAYRPYIDLAKVRYDFTNWVGTTKTNYVYLATNWVPDLAALGATSLLYSSTHPYSNTNPYGYGCLASSFGFRATNDTSIVVSVETHAVLSVTNAHESMVIAFAQNNVPYLFVVGEGLGVSIGDRCYLGPGTNDDRVVFVRNNVLVELDADNPDAGYDYSRRDGSHRTNCYSVIGIARALDEQIRKISVGE
ncbi:MAG: hypothetical protein WCL44_14665 [bacterium]